MAGLRIEYNTPCPICEAEGKGGTIGFENGKFCCQNGHEVEDVDGGVTRKLLDDSPQNEAKIAPSEGVENPPACTEFEKADSAQERVDQERFAEVQQRRKEPLAVSAHEPEPVGGLAATGGTLETVPAHEGLAAGIACGKLLPLVPMDGEFALPGGDVLVAVRIPELYLGAIRELAQSAQKTLAQWLTDEFLIPRIEQEFSLPNSPV